ncbi:hypothetical protein GCM10007231_24690 [Nocardioides daphniae]|uniref:Uncharacterized protein n=1 Tax=Nocardioides daphniae TaxID=402297 RepID=A0ABQ1QEM9_9ACTN|nr:hypothetical protein GCM10007231_24690 [Nocardioides daphniae]
MRALDSFVSAPSLMTQRKPIVPTSRVRSNQSGSLERQQALSPSLPLAGEDWCCLPAQTDPSPSCTT